MNASQRREKIKLILEGAAQAVSASSLAERLQVSRQIIVGDIALLRAKGLDILATPKGYILNLSLTNNNLVFKIACLHSAELTREEIYTIVDNGGKLLDVIVEHSVYGQLIGQLNISSRYDTDDFLKKVAMSNANLLCNLTDGIHLHTISCKDEQAMCRIKNALDKMNILLDEK